MSDDRPLFIVNPAASGGRSGRLFEGLRAPVAKLVGDADFEFTGHGGHARDLARQAALEGRKRIVAVGGDGTLSEVASGVLDTGSTESAVGLLHLGTGGDFRRSLDLDHRPDSYLKAIAEGETKRVDAGRITHLDREGEEAQGWFVNVLSLGMGGLVDKFVGRSDRMFGGKAGYFAAALEALAKGALGKLECEVTLDGKTETVRLSTRNLAICNGRYFGSGMEVAPMARLDDGVFEVIGIGGERRLPVLSLSAAIYSGSHIGRRDVTYLRANSISIRMANPEDAGRFLLDVDGEWLGRAPVTVEAVKGALRVLC